MTYLRPHSRPLGGKSRVIGTIAGIIIVLVLLINWRAPHAFSGMLSALARPFWRTSFAIESGALRSPEQLLKENSELRFELDGLKQSIASTSIEAVLNENEELRSMFHRASTTPYTLAAVLVRPPYMPYDELIIDLGIDDGLATTTKVYAPGNVLIGRVREVMSQTSKVLLFSSPGQKYNILLGPDHVPATALGIGGGQYRTDVPHGTTLSVGDAVSDSSFKDGIMGTIVSVVTDPANPFDTILFAPDINIYSLRWVVVDTRSEAKPKK